MELGDFVVVITWGDPGCGFVFAVGVCLVAVEGIELCVEGEVDQGCQGRDHGQDRHSLALQQRWHVAEVGGTKGEKRK